MKITGLAKLNAGIRDRRGIWENGFIAVVSFVATSARESASCYSWTAQSGHPTHPFNAAAAARFAVIRRECKT